jgi:hypothetical protein
MLAQLNRPKSNQTQSAPIAMLRAILPASRSAVSPAPSNQSFGISSRTDPTTQIFTDFREWVLCCFLFLEFTGVSRVVCLLAWQLCRIGAGGLGLVLRRMRDVTALECDLT